MNTTKQPPEMYWSLLTDCPFPAFFSGKGSKLDHSKTQWLFQGAMMHMTLQAMVSVDHNDRANFQTKVRGTDHRVYSPIGYYMAEDDFDYFESSSYIPNFFPEDEWLQHIVSNYVGWVITRDQAMMLMHLDIIHDNYPIEDMFDQFEYVAQHFGLFLPSRDEKIPVLNKPPEAVQPHLQLVH